MSIVLPVVVAAKVIFPEFCQFTEDPIVDKLPYILSDALPEVTGVPADMVKSKQLSVPVMLTV